MASSHGLVGLLAGSRRWYGSGMVQLTACASSCMVPSTSVPGVGVGASANKGSAHKGFLQGQTRDFTAVAAVAVDAAPLRAMTVRLTRNIGRWGGRGEARAHVRVLTKKCGGGGSHVWLTQVAGGRRW